MTDLVQPLAAHAATFPAARLEASVRDHLALDLVDGSPPSLAVRARRESPS